MVDSQRGATACSESSQRGLRASLHLQSICKPVRMVLCPALALLSQRQIRRAGAGLSYQLFSAVARLSGHGLDTGTAADVTRFVIEGPGAGESVDTSHEWAHINQLSGPTHQHSPQCNAPVTHLAHQLVAISRKSSSHQFASMTTTTSATRSHSNQRPQLLKADQDNIRTFSAIGLSPLSLSCIWLTDLETIYRILK